MLILQAIDQHGAHEPSFIGNGAHGHHHLQPSHSDPLAHWYLGNRYFAPIAYGVNDSGHLARQRYAGGSAKAEIADIIVKAGLAHFDSNLPRPDIRGLGNDAFDR